MRTLFADAGYWVAIMYPGDQLHRQARGMAANLASARIVTTQMALTEALNFMSSLGEFRRRFAAEMVQQLQNNPSVEIVEQTDTQFRVAVERYVQRSDQTWSLTDCASFLVMEEQNITEALAYDRDFEQAGFVALLREGQGLT